MAAVSKVQTGGSVQAGQNIQTSHNTRSTSQTKEAEAARRTHRKPQAAEDQAQAPAAKPASAHLGTRIDVTA